MPAIAVAYKSRRVDRAVPVFNSDIENQAVVDSESPIVAPVSFK